MRRVTVPAVLAGVALAASACGGVMATTYHDDNSYDVTGQVAKLRVRADSGNIEVVGADVGKVTVHERISYTKKRKPATEHKTVNGELVLSYDCPGGITIGYSECDVSYRVQVPRAMAASVSTGSGRLQVAGINGAVQARNDSGSIMADNLRGSLDAYTGSGLVKMTTVAGGVKAVTDSGNINGSGLGGAVVDARTGSGNVVLRFDKAPSSVDAMTDSGNVAVWVPGSERYAVSTKIDSGNENILVDRSPNASHKIDATTGSGNVTVSPNEASGDVSGSGNPAEPPPARQESPSRPPRP